MRQTSWGIRPPRGGAGTAWLAQVIAAAALGAEWVEDGEADYNLLTPNQLRVRVKAAQRAMRLLDPSGEPVDAVSARFRQFPPPVEALDMYVFVCLGSAEVESTAATVQRTEQGLGVSSSVVVPEVRLYQAGVDVVAETFSPSYTTDESGDVHLARAAGQLWSPVSRLTELDFE